MDAGHTNVFAVAVVLSAVFFVAVALHVVDVYKDKRPHHHDIPIVTILYAVCPFLSFVVLFYWILLEDNHAAMLLLGATVAISTAASYGIGVEIETKRPQRHVGWLLAAAALLATGTATAASAAPLHVTKLLAAWGFAAVVSGGAWMWLRDAGFQQPKYAAKHNTAPNDLKVTLPGHSGHGRQQASPGGQKPDKEQRRVGDSPSGPDARDQAGCNCVGGSVGQPPQPPMAAGQARPGS